MKRNKRKKSSNKKKLGRYASAIEKYCEDKLKAHKLAFDYEQHSFELLPKFRYPNKYFKMTAKKKEMSDKTNAIVLPITYKPDFMGKKHNWVIETKGFLPSHHDFPMRWKLFLNHLVGLEDDYIVFLAKNKGQVDHCIKEIIQSIKDGKI